MNKIYILVIIAGSFISYINAQQQNHIFWPSLADSPWPVLRGDMQGTGRSQFIGPRTNNVLWKKDMPLGVLYGPVIGYNDVLYMGERALSPDSVNYFYAVDKNGNDQWIFETNTFYANNSGPILGKDSTIYFASRNWNFYALKPDGILKWMVENIQDGFWPSWPMAKNGDIYLGINDTLIIISQTGFIKSKKFIPDLSPPMAFSTGGDTIFFYTGGFANTSGSLNAADLNGNIYWSYNFAILNWGIPVIDNQNKVYVFGADSQWTYYLSCIKPNGELDWNYNVGLFLDFSAPTIDKNGNIILNARKIINSEEKDCIVSLDYNGNENWITPFEGDLNEHYINHGLVCDAEGKIYCGSSAGGNFYCFDNNGELLWTLDLGELEYDSCPAIGSDGTLYIGTHISSLFQNHTQNLIAIRDTVTSVENDDPRFFSYQLEQNFPNPFNSTTNIKYKIPQSIRVELEVYDLMGRKVATLIDRYQQAGSYDVIFQADNLASGIYFYQLQAGKFIATKKLILLK